MSIALALLLRFSPIQIGYQYVTTLLTVNLVFTTYIMQEDQFTEYVQNIRTYGDLALWSTLIPIINLMYSEYEPTEKLGLQVWKNMLGQVACTIALVIV
jgi:hypothetical protein